MSKLYYFKIMETREKTLLIRAQSTAAAKGKALSRLDRGLVDLSDAKPKLRLAVMNTLGRHLLCQEVA